MRGLTDAEYALLCKAASYDLLALEEREDILAARMPGIGRLRRCRDLVIEASPLGRLALSLWPAIRVGR